MGKARKHRSTVSPLACGQRVLSVVVTPRTLTCSHERVDRDGEAPLRLEICLDCTRADLLVLLGRALGVLASGYETLLDPEGVQRCADRFEKLDLRSSPFEAMARQLAGIDGSEPGKPIGGLALAPSIAAASLARAYRQEPAAARQAYEPLRLRVTGVVKRAERIDGVPQLVLAGDPDGSIDVLGVFSPEDGKQVLSLQPGAEVIVSGRVSGMDCGFVLMACAGVAVAAPSVMSKVKQ